MKTRFIVNPRSGRAARAEAAVQAFVARHGADLVRTQRPRHAADLARQALADGCGRIVAVGGDGTMNEIAGVLVGTSAVLGLVPCGSGDGLGRHLGIHGSVARALRILECGEPRTIDSGVADGHPFFSVAGIGLEAEIAAAFNRLERRGFLRYLTTGLRVLRTWRPLDLTVTGPAGRYRARAFTLAVANTDQYGNNARIAPGARIDDGCLDLSFVPPIGPANALPLVAGLFGGFLADVPGIRLFRDTAFSVERPAPGLLHTDGEVHETGRVVEFQIRPASLRVMAPPAN